MLAQNVGYVITNTVGHFSYTTILNGWVVACKLPGLLLDHSIQLLPYNNCMSAVVQSEAPPRKRSLLVASLAFLALRGISLGWVWLVGTLTPPLGLALGPEILPVPGYINPASFFQVNFLAPWLRWDTLHYLDIAIHGYSSANKNSVWVPLYPILIRGLTWFTHLNPLLAALIISSLATWGLFYAVHRLVSVQWNGDTADRTLLVAAVFPASFFLVAGYTESLFLLFVVTCFICLRQNHWLQAGGLAALAALTRNLGILLAFPILWEAGKAWYLSSPRRWQTALLGILAAGLPVLAFAGFISYTHWVLAASWPWQSLNTAWELHFAFPWTGLLGNIHALSLIFRGIYVSLGNTSLDLVFSLAALMLLFFARKKLPVSYQLYSWSLLLVSMSKLTAENLLWSMVRYVLVLFPVWIVLAEAIKKPVVKLIWLAVSLFLFLSLLAVFFEGYWVA